MCMLFRYMNLFYIQITWMLHLYHVFFQCIVQNSQFLKIQSWFCMSTATSIFLLDVFLWVALLNIHVAEVTNLIQTVSPEPSSVVVMAHGICHRQGANVSFTLQWRYWLQYHHRGVVFGVWCHFKRCKTDAERPETLGCLKYITPTMVNHFASQSPLLFFVMYVVCTWRNNDFVFVSSPMSTVKVRCPLLAFCWYSWFQVLLLIDIEKQRNIVNIIFECFPSWILQYSMSELWYWAISLIHCFDQAFLNS